LCITIPYIQLNHQRLHMTVTSDIAACSVLLSCHVHGRTAVASHRTLLVQLFCVLYWHALLQASLFNGRLLNSLPCVACLC
jgi:hypothetical protein